MSLSSASALLQISNINNDLVSTLLGSKDDSSDSFADILEAKSSAATLTGRNMTLKDPESAYGMMTHINGLEVSFKAQFSELSEMGNSVEQMEEVGRSLSDIAPTTANADIAARLQAFIDQYNRWEDRFDDTVADGGVLDNVQAADVSLYELEQSVQNIFNGAADGVRGLSDLGIEINPVSKQATFDVAKLNAVLASNKSGVVNAIDEFSANFAKSADLLNADGNFIQNALDSRSRALDYVASNRESLQQEFGTGDAAQPEEAVAKALSAYESAFSIG